MEICNSENCTGCGMCSNVCPKGAITMQEGLNDFVFPVIDTSLCVDCGICQKTCPSNKEKSLKENVKKAYAAWSTDKTNRRNSTSGGIFTVLAKSIINRGGVVAGVVWNSEFHPEHVIIDNIEELYRFKGSKYSQSITSDIYSQVFEQLKLGKKVLFSGTPCQNAALKMFLGKEYDNLYLLDVVCHGVPSNCMLDKHYSQFGDTLKTVNLRMKDPYWDYSYVRIEFEHQKPYQALTIEDDYFNLFNIGFSLRESCHNCQYASTNRQADITLADFWGYTAHSVKTVSYNKGTSLILVNTEKGEELLEKIKNEIFIEESTVEKAKRGNKCLSEPFTIEDKTLSEFWKDYNDGVSIKELNDKYAANTFTLPVLLNLRRFYHKWKWIVGK